MNKITPQQQALHRLIDVILEGRSLTDVLRNQETTPIVKEMCFGVLRHYERLEHYLKSLLDKPLKPKEEDLKIWLMLGLYQLEYMQAPDYAVVSEMAGQTKQINKPWAKGLVNAILRNFLRERETLQAKAEKQLLFPSWLNQKIQSTWPTQAKAIIEASNQQAPLCLRVNIRKQSREEYLALLETQAIPAYPGMLSPSAIYLEKALPVEAIPGFKEGKVSIQDESAQLAALLLDVKAGMDVLDACAAPGGKTAHLLEEADVKLIAVDVSASRCTFIQENLQRLQLHAEIQAMDALAFAKQQVPSSFDRILLDAPCSATGVIRRHPDIKRHRREADLLALTKLQQALLEHLWPLLRPKGVMLYATCSVLQEENDRQIENFLQAHVDAKWQRIDLSVGQATKFGWQLFPQSATDQKSFAGDGFYYALLCKGE